MGCNTSQEQKSAVADENGDVNVNGETVESNDKHKSASSSVENGTSSANSEKLTNGHADSSTISKSEGNSLFLSLLYFVCC